MPLSKALSYVIPSETRKFFNQLQWEEFKVTCPKNILLQFRNFWYHDPLVHQINHPYMRIIRKCRLGTSELRAHAWYLNQHRSRICEHCNLGVEETLDHLFYTCPAFSDQRERYLANVAPILSDLNLPNTTASLLGFSDRLRFKNFSSSHHICDQRRLLFTHTCQFLKSTDRFKYV